MAQPLEVCLVVLAVAAALWDLRWRRIPDWLTAAGCAAGLLGNFFVSGTAGIGHSALGLGLALLIYIPLWGLRAVGGGDVKLMGAIGSLTGARSWLAIFVTTALIGLLFAILFVLMRARIGKTARNLALILSELSQWRLPYKRHPELDVSDPQAATLPHGVSIALGVLLILILRKP